MEPSPVFVEHPTLNPQTFFRIARSDRRIVALPWFKAIFRPRIRWFLCLAANKCLNQWYASRKKIKTYKDWICKHWYSPLVFRNANIVIDISLFTQHYWHWFIYIYMSSYNLPCKYHSVLTSICCDTHVFGWTFQVGFWAYELFGRAWFDHGASGGDAGHCLAVMHLRETNKSYGKMDILKMNPP